MAGSFAKISGHGMVLDTTVLDRITKELKPKARRIVQKYGVQVMSDSAQNAPVGTEASTGIKGYVGGSLRNSITSESRMTGDMTYTVSDGVEYGVYQEFGTSKMAAQPFMRPAIEAWTEKFLNAFSELFK
jgi:HK97 gp10 family phage protein